MRESFEQKPEQKENDEKNTELNMAITEAEKEMAYIKDADVAKKIAYSVKDFIDIYSDIKDKAENIRTKLIEETPLTQEQLKSIQERLEDLKGKDRFKEYGEWIEKYLNIKHGFIIKQLEEKRLTALADIFKYMAEGYERQMISDAEQKEKKGESKETILKSIASQALLAKINGKLWKLKYKIHGTNMTFRVEGIGLTK